MFNIKCFTIQYLFSAMLYTFYGVNPFPFPFSHYGKIVGYLAGLKLQAKTLAKKTTKNSIEKKDNKVKLCKLCYLWRKL